MKRSPMPRRGSGLRRTTGLRDTPMPPRVAPMRRTGGLPNQRQPLGATPLLRKPAKPTEDGLVPGPPVVRLPAPRLKAGGRTIDGRLRRAVLDRSEHRCDWCASSIPDGSHWECHHRKLRSQGGRDELACLIALHHPCHRAVHANRDRLSYATGFLVPSTADPALWPLLRHRGTGLARWSLPDDTTWIAAVPCSRQIELGATPDGGLLPAADIPDQMED